MSLPRVAIIYLTYHSDAHLSDAFGAWTKLMYPKDRLVCVIVDNRHPEHGSGVSAIEAQLATYPAGALPETVILAQTENLGFAGGNNAGIEWALAHGCDYVFLHNDDGLMDAGCLEPLVQAMENDKTIGLAQALLLLYPETQLVNAAGNAYHYLGFGFCNNYRTPVNELRLQPVSDINYASGAAVMLRADLLKRFGLWDKDFFLYHEDMEYSLRLRMAGYRAVLVTASRFFHKYNFNKSMEKFYWMERNRFGVLLMFFRIPTLILLAPMLCFLEIGLWIFAVRGGWWKERLKVYAYWADPAHWRLWLGKRRAIQNIRKIRDRDILATASPTIQFQEAAMENPALAYLGNPLMTVYYWVIVRGLVWW
jgi:GT2 family glycosyltransferase